MSVQVTSIISENGRLDDLLKTRTPDELLPVPGITGRGLERIPDAVLDVEPQRTLVLEAGRCASAFMRSILGSPCAAVPEGTTDFERIVHGTVIESLRGAASGDPAVHGKISTRAESHIPECEAGHVISAVARIVAVQACHEKYWEPMAPRGAVEKELLEMVRDGTGGTSGAD